MMSEAALYLLIWAGGALAYYPFIVRWIRKDRDFKVDDLFLTGTIMVWWPLVIGGWCLFKLSDVLTWGDRMMNRAQKKTKAAFNAMVDPLFDKLAITFVETGRWISRRLPDPNTVLLPRREIKV
jgi:hypothetical protein